MESFEAEMCTVVYSSCKRADRSTFQNKLFHAKGKPFIVVQTRKQFKIVARVLAFKF